MGQKRLRDGVLTLGQHGSRPSKRPGRRPASVVVCFSARACWEVGKLFRFARQQPLVKGQHRSRMHLQVRLCLHRCLHLRVVFPELLPCIQLLPT